ncbi:MAG: ferredoxin--NADP reductase [Janthinobacterium lividum]
MQYTLKIAAIIQETEDTITLIFNQPGLKKIKYQAGQYLTLIFNINNRRYLRPYSFSSTPEVDSTLNITIKRVPGGIVSNHIADCLKVGNAVEVMEPMGNFTIESKNIGIGNSLVFWAAGSGITPLFSLLKRVLNYNLAKHITLVYGNRNAESTVFNEQIFALQKQYYTTFKVWHFHTKLIVEDLHPEIVQGRIDPEKVIAVLKQENDLTNTRHFICGPYGLKESVENLLMNNGIGQESIYHEDFDLITDPKKFEGISTRNIIIRKSGKLYPVEVVKGRTILDACLDSLIDLSYSCQTGSCLLCKARLICGELRSISGDVTNLNLGNNEYLLCCNLPLTDDVELAVD